jgi:sugar (pentulose or hexulose) kinase
MSAKPVIAVFDVGKTNKKLFLFDEDYRVVFERSARFIETVDEDGFPCENVENLKLSVFDALNEVSRLEEFEIKAVNFSAYGASFVNLDKSGKPVTALYNYLKPYPPELSRQLYDNYGGDEEFSRITASPLLGGLNSGLQLYRLKQEQPQLFKRIKYALHLPQYLSSLLTGKYYSDMTSVGCHTALWDFEKKQYHQWVRDEGIAKKLPPILPAETVLSCILPGANYKVGIGLHDSSAALIPYLLSFEEPFILISTGTWCISLNPFDHSPITAAELKLDCLRFLQYNGRPVKASRLFSGAEHEEQVKKIASHFNTDIIKYRNVAFDPAFIQKHKTNGSNSQDFKQSRFSSRDLNTFKNDIEAYHQLIADLVDVQVLSTGLLLKNTKIKKLFVDGGFSKNSVFMQLLAAAMPEISVYAASMAQASAVGAALSIHREWSGQPVPQDIIQLIKY